VSFVGLNFS